MDNMQDLGNGVDYTVLADIIQFEFAKPRHLLEELIVSIEKSIINNFPGCAYLLLSIRKHNPPLGINIENSEVSLEKKYVP